jgi:osmoprotectant transport system ATP-binding protein
MIELRNISKHYKNTIAVDDISFDVKESETLVLLGTSGCGKTTTLRMINRLEQPTSGTIFLDKSNINERPVEELRRGIGYVLQHHGLFPHYTVAENISVVPKLLKWQKSTIDKRTVELLEKLHLPENISQLYPSQLSGGQQQRIGLARALAGSPPVLLMDEPFGALDPVTRASIRREFKQLDELKKKTVVMVTHDVQEAFELGDRICLMHDGNIVQIGTAADLLFHPASDFVSRFLQEQRLQLELETITINDIWHSLPKAIDKLDQSPVDFDSNLWAALETISDPKGASLNFIIAHGNEKRQVNTASIMSGYQEFKMFVAI